ncbi:MAG: zinc-binding dehydrogenase, partial [Acidobacteriia bacterium]|nr:zinc-binding dehydrogenase [Terriglobia bacterium]
LRRDAGGASGRVSLHRAGRAGLGPGLAAGRPRSGAARRGGGRRAGRPPRLAADHHMAGGGWVQMLQVVLLGPLLSLVGRKKMRLFMANINHKDLVLLKDLLEAGKVVPVIDRRYPLSEVAEAIRYLEEGHARGKVVITL